MNNNHLPNDDKLQAAADVTWTNMDSDDRLGQAIKDSAATDLPDANLQLRELLMERLTKESDVKTENETTECRTTSNKTVSKESMPPTKSWKLSGAPFDGWATALCVCLMLGLLGMLLMPAGSWRSAKQDSSQTRQAELARQSFADTVKHLSPSVDGENQQGGIGFPEDQRNESFMHRSGQDSAGEQSGSQFGTINQIGGVEVNPDGLLNQPSYNTFGPKRKHSAGERGSDGNRQGQQQGQQGDSGGGQSILPGGKGFSRDVVLKERGERILSGTVEKSVADMLAQLNGTSRSFPRALDSVNTNPLKRGNEYGFGENPIELDENDDGIVDAYWREQLSGNDGDSGEVYNQIYENQFLRTRGDQAVSTFSIDVDTAAYANMRRFLSNGQRPPANSVRIEELINYFNYDYPQPEGDTPFSANMEVASCPWNADHQLIRVGLKGKEVHRDERPVSNLVFLLDVSGSMNNQDKLPLLKRGLRMMIDQLGENDRISIVTYAGNAGVVLEPTSGDQKKKIHEAIERLSSGGSTHGSAGIEKAYNLAVRNFVEGGVNRVIWATDGDLNVGITDDQTLINLVSERAQEGVFLTTLGFGTGNLKDGKLEQIANKGNGIYAYIDSMREAHKVLVEQMSGSLVTIAKDVKLQIEFNPAEVIAYRLIGYENRMLATEDFDNDAKDAGEIGAGHTVTAIYEVVPVGAVAANDPAPSQTLKYQTSAEENGKKDAKKEAGNEHQSDVELSDASQTGDLLTLALRFKQPDADESTRIEFILKDSDQHFDEASNDFRFASSVAGFGMLLRGSKFRGSVTPKMIETIASGAIGDDSSGYRAEFLDLVRRVR